uniref:Methyltransferase domain-containing protein n=1 Tax=Timspurckia oligopyrenoides TaxID=708627 RepID=A0A7S0ZJ34_9RHOD
MNVNRKAGEKLVHELLEQLELNLDGSLDVYSSLKYPNVEDHQRLGEFFKNGFEALDPGVDPGSTDAIVNHVRGQHKREQVQAIVLAASSLMLCMDSTNRRKVGVDFCGGRGVVGITLAALFPEWDIVVLDLKPGALKLVQTRNESLKLKNIKTWQGDVSQFQVDFDLAVALHSCGIAADLVLQKALIQRAPFVIVPCCTGAVVPQSAALLRVAMNKAMISSKTNESSTTNGLKNELQNENLTKNSSQEVAKIPKIPVSMPRSILFQRILNESCFCELAQAADFGQGELDMTKEYCWRRAAKTLLELDRIYACIDQGYRTLLMKIRPLTASPKNDMLVGWPKECERFSKLEEQITVDTFVPSISSLAESSKWLDVSESHFAAAHLQLKQFCADPSVTQICIAQGLGSVARKAAHAAAESLELKHTSTGKGNRRSVLVEKQVMSPLEIRFRGYIGFFGSKIESIAKLALSKNVVPESALNQRLRLRGSEFHMTLCSSIDIKQYGKANEVLDRCRRQLSCAEITVLGIGCVEEKIGLSENKVYFVVVQCAAAQNLRLNLGLLPFDFHITLGFDVKDIHGVRKDRSTIFYSFL